MHGNAQLALIQDDANSGSAGEPDHSSDEHGERAVIGSGGNAVDERDDLGSLSHHYDAGNDRKNEERPDAGSDLPANFLGLCDKLARVAGHPQIVPGEHAESRSQHGGVQYFLAGALERVRNDGSKSRNDSAADADGNTARDPTRSPCGGHNDNADDERCFQHLAADDYRDGKHRLSAHN